jgi:hypothetical protein
MVVQGVQGAVGGSNEAIELGKFEEEGDRPNTTRSLMVEGDEGGVDQAAEKGFADGGADEGDELGWQVGRARVTQPVPES